MKVTLNHLNNKNDRRDDVILLEVNCASDNLKEDRDTFCEIENEMSCSDESEKWLPNRVEKIGGWFRLNTPTSSDQSLQNKIDDLPFEVFCCNLTSSEKDKNHQTMLLHVDHWRRQANKQKLQS